MLRLIRSSELEQFRDKIYSLQDALATQRTRSIEQGQIIRQLLAQHTGDDKMWTSYHLGSKDDRKKVYEIVNVKTGKFLNIAGFGSMEEAKEKAINLLKSDPSLELYIYAPVLVMTADVPIKEEAFKNV